MPSTSFFTYWYLHLPSLALAAVIFLLLGRLALAPVLGAHNIVMRVLAAITEPVLATVGAITPRIVPPAALIALAIVWLAALRVVVVWIALAKGVRL
jgi:uncharacterized protein YggT (Ycf19 family)